MFENPLLEWLSHVHPATPFVFWLPVAGASFYMGWRSDLSLTAMVWLALSGLFVWTLVEYGLHRYVFHFTNGGPIVEKIHFYIHGVHHDDPDDETRLVMPLTASLFLGVLLFVPFYFILGAPWVWPFFGAFLLGYLFYDFTHFSVHAYRDSGISKTWIGRAWIKNHMIHHYLDPNICWGVSSPFWDIVFGTWLPAREQRSADNKHLHV